MSENENENEPPPASMPAPAAAALAEAKQILRQLGGCALLIGVEAYDGLPTEKQLLAGRNDVLAYWKVCRRLGYRPEHIRVLTSPALGKDDIARAEQDLGPELHPELGADELRALVERWFAGPDPVVLGDASRDSIMKGVEWLASKLVFTVRLEWDDWKLEQELAGLPGLLAYSGHGAHHQDDLVLCPSDVGPGLERALPFAQLRALIDAGDDIRAPGTPHPADNLTVVLDCCFAAAGEQARTVRVPTLTPGASGPVPAIEHEIGTRVFCASGRDERAYQGLFGGHWHGAFTWAFTRALEQWKTAPSGQFRKSTVSHVELLFRTRMLLEALSFDQRPVLVDRLANLPVFQHSADVTRATSAEPDAPRLFGQIDPSDGFAYYEISDGNGNPLAKIVATAAADNYGSRMHAKQEYWQIVGDAFDSREHATLRVQRVRHGHFSATNRPPFSAAEAHFRCGVDLPWVNKTASYSSVHSASNTPENPSAFRVIVKRENGVWGGWMGFYRKHSKELVFKGVDNLPFTRLDLFEAAWYCLVNSSDIITITG